MKAKHTTWSSHKSASELLLQRERSFLERSHIQTWEYVHPLTPFRDSDECWCARTDWHQGMRPGWRDALCSL